MTNNDEKFRALLEAAAPELLFIYELMSKNDIDPQDIMRALYLITNVQKLCEWGKVGFTIKHGEIINVWQEQQFISEKELSKK